MSDKSLAEDFAGVLAIEADNRLPEAPASVNVYLFDPWGNKTQWTLRDLNEETLFLRYSVLIENLYSEGWKSTNAPMPEPERQPAGATANGSSVTPQEAHKITGDK